jgi:hypothetical protein
MLRSSFIFLTLTIILTCLFQPAWAGTFPPTIFLPISSPLLAQAILESSDLPPRFEPAPPFLERLIFNGIAAVNPVLEQEGITLDQISTFVAFEQAEMVMALKANLPNQQGIERFDFQLRRPDVQELFVAGLQRSLVSLGKIKITKVEELSSLEGIGELARGFAIEAKFIRLPLRIYSETVVFRRGYKGVLIVLGILDRPINDLTIQDLARQLDRRLQLKIKN